MNHTDLVLQKIARYTPQDILLADVAVRIQLSPTEYEQAVSHYAVMAAWIDRPDSPLYGLVDSLYPQGGFSTGSTIAAHDADAHSARSSHVSSSRAACSARRARRAATGSGARRAARVIRRSSPRGRRRRTR